MPDETPQPLPAPSAGDPSQGDPHSGSPSSGSPSSGHASNGGHSYGNMSDQHWSRTRGARNAEAIDYYRERSHAPGVAEGGAARNSYCMACDGVIPWDGFEGGACPHCGAKLEGNTRRFFNWVEIDRAPTGDARAVLPLLALAVALLAGVIALVWWWLA